MELKEVHSDLHSLAKLYSLLHEDLSRAVSFILDERTRFLLKKLLDDAVDKLLAIHCKIIVAAKSGVSNTPKSSSSTILKTVKHHFEPPDSANEESNLGSKRLSKEEQSIVKPITTQEAGSKLVRVDGISSKADDGTKRCKVCPHSKSKNQVVNSKDDLSHHVDCDKLQGPSEKDSKALIPATTVEKLQRKPSVARSVVSVSTSPGTEIEEHNGKLEEIVSDFLKSLLKALRETEPTGNHKGSTSNSEREIQRKPSVVRSVVSASDSSGTGTAEKDWKREKIVKDFSKKLLNKIKEPEPSSLRNNTRNQKGSPSKYEREVPENMNKTFKVRAIVQRIESNNGRVKGSESYITPTFGSKASRAKSMVTKSKPYIPSEKGPAGRQTHMKPTLLNYYNADSDKHNDHTNDDNASSWSDKKNHVERSSSFEESEDELTPSSSQSDPGSSFNSSTRKRQISTSSHSLPRSISSSVPETNTDDSYVSSWPAASSATSGTYSDQDTYSSQRNHRTTGLLKLCRLTNKLGLIFHHHHHHHHHLKNNRNRSKLRNANQMVMRKINNHKYEKKAVEELGKAVANNPKHETKVVEELGKAAAVEELGRAAAASNNKKKQNHHDELFHGLAKGR